jgi:hypothetical protein
MARVDDAPVWDRAGGFLAVPRALDDVVQERAACEPAAGAEPISCHGDLDAVAALLEVAARVGRRVAQQGHGARPAPMERQWSALLRTLSRSASTSRKPPPGSGVQERRTPSGDVHRNRSLAAPLSLSEARREVEGRGAHVDDRHPGPGRCGRRVGDAPLARNRAVPNVVRAHEDHEQMCAVQGRRGHYGELRSRSGRFAEGAGRRPPVTTTAGGRRRARNRIERGLGGAADRQTPPRALLGRVSAAA